MSPVADRLGDVRRRRGMTQEQLAERAGVSVSVVRKLERGERNGGRMATLLALARALERRARPVPDDMGELADFLDVP